jgi:hypothetical protein
MMIASYFWFVIVTPVIFGEGRFARNRIVRLELAGHWVEGSTLCRSIDIARVPDCRFFRFVPTIYWLADCDQT